MKDFVKRLLCRTFVLILLSSFAFAFASEYSSLYLDSYSAAVTPVSGGKMVVSVDVMGRGEQEMLGATRIIIYESTDNKVFKRVVSYSYEDYPAMMGSGAFYYDDPVTYYGTPGYYYKASVYVYAGDGVNGTERNYTTSSKRAIS